MGDSMGVVALDVVGKTSGLLGLAFAVDWGLGRRRALARSALWNGVLVGLILIPAASLALPRWSWPLLASRPTDPPTPGSAGGRATGGARPIEREMEPTPSSLPRMAPAEAAPVSRLGVAPSGRGATPGGGGVMLGRSDLGRMVMGVYLAVVAAGLVRLALGLRAVGRLRRVGQPLLDPAWVDAVEAGRARLGIRRGVMIRTSSRVAVPVVVGWWRPTILIPEGLSLTASPDLIDSILVHELAHVRRGDYGWNLARALVQALYWPDPLTWPLRRIIGTVREQACDDFCVGILGGAEQYRASLLAVAAHLVGRRSAGLSLGLAMARPGHLAARLAWIDRSPGATTCLLAWPTRWAVLAGLTGLAGAVGVVELAEAQPQQPRMIEVEFHAQDTGLLLAGATVQGRLDQRGVEGLTGTVVDAQGKAIAGAEVAWFAEKQLGTNQASPWTTTDAAGSFQFRQVEPGRIFVLAKAPGHAPELKLADAGPGVGPIAVTLGPPHLLAGRVVDTRGRPIAEAEVTLVAWRNNRALDVSLRTDHDGRFRWEDAPADPVTISVQHPGFLGVDWKQVVAGGDEVGCTLQRSVSVGGQIHDSTTGQVVATNQVRIDRFNPIHGAFLWGFGRSLHASQGQFFGAIAAEPTSEFRVQVQAEGYEPFESPTLRTDGGPVRLDVKLVPRTQPEDRTVAGTVRTPDGQPLAGAQVALTYSEESRPATRARIWNSQLQPGERQASATTDAAGRFSLQRNAGLEGKAYAVVVAHPSGYAQVEHAAFEANPVITTQPWGRIEGVARRNGQPVPGAAVVAWSDTLNFHKVPFFDQAETTADASGRFVVERISAGDIRITGRTDSSGVNQTWNNGEIVQVESGQTTRVDLNSRGRPVVARVAVPAGFGARATDWRQSQVSLQSETYGQIMTFPADLLARGDGSAFEWGKRWWTSPAGYAFRRSQFQTATPLQPDGTVRLDDIPPGSYAVTITLSTSAGDGVGGTISQVATATRKFTVPPIPGGRLDEPLDLGTLALEPGLPRSDYRPGVGPPPPPG